MKTVVSCVAEKSGKYTIVSFTVYSLFIMQSLYHPNDNGFENIYSNVFNYLYSVDKNKCEIINN